MKAAQLLVTIAIFAGLAFAILASLSSCAPVTCLYSHDHNRCGF